jgi:hypothetical protein
LRRWINPTARGSSQSSRKAHRLYGRFQQIPSAEQEDIINDTSMTPTITIQVFLPAMPAVEVRIARAQTSPFLPLQAIIDSGADASIVPLL